MRPDARIGGRAYLTDKKSCMFTTCCADPDIRREAPATEADIGSVLGVPLLRGDEAIGVFTLAHEREAVHRQADRLLSRHLPIRQ